MSAEDPLDVLERIHRDVKLLRELAGDALVITIAPAEQKADSAPPGDVGVRRTPAAAKEADGIVRNYLRAHGPTRKAAVVEGTGLKKSRVRDALERLERAGEARPTGATGRVPGQSGRASPIWELVDPGSDPELDAPPAVEEPEPAPELVDPEADAGAPTSLPLSPRVRKSIERDQAEAQAIAALGEPPESRVLDLLRHGTYTIKELAGELGEHQAVVAEEVHGLKPWLIQLHDGRLRAIERLRPAEAA